MSADTANYFAFRRSLCEPGHGSPEDLHALLVEIRDLLKELADRPKIDPAPKMAAVDRLPAAKKASPADATVDRPDEATERLIVALEKLLPILDRPPALASAPKMVEAMARLSAGGLEPTLEPDDWMFIYKVSRREVDRLRSSGFIPEPDFYLGKKSPRWLARTARKSLEERGATR